MAAGYLLPLSSSVIFFLRFSYPSARAVHQKGLKSVAAYRKCFGQQSRLGISCDRRGLPLCNEADLSESAGIHLIGGLLTLTVLGCVLHVIFTDFILRIIGKINTMKIEYDRRETAGNGKRV